MVYQRISLVRRLNTSFAEPHHAMPSLYAPLRFREGYVEEIYMEIMSIAITFHSPLHIFLLDATIFSSDIFRPCSFFCARCRGHAMPMDALMRGFAMLESDTPRHISIFAIMIYCYAIVVDIHVPLRRLHRALLRDAATSAAAICFERKRKRCFLR